MTTFTESVTDGIALSDSLSTSYSLQPVVIDSLSVSDHATLKYLAGQALAELVALHESLTFRVVTPVALAELVALSERIGLALLAKFSDSVAVADVVSVTRGVLVADALGFTDLVSLSGVYPVSVIDAIVASDVLAWFWGGKFSDRVAFAETVSLLEIFSQSAADAITISDTFTPLFQVRVLLNDALDISDEATLIGIYNQTLSDSFAFSFAFLDPSGDFTTWAINTRTGAVTEYQNYDYNSFAQMGHHFLGASSSGLYQLDGALDVTQAIQATVKSGSAQFSGSRYTAFDAIYLGCRVSDGGRDWLLKLHTGDGQCYIYQFQPLNRRTTKIFVGKGLRARYFSWELVTAGENFDLDSIEFVPISSKRRV
jgi:hypothetical protein